MGVLTLNSFLGEAHAVDPKLLADTVGVASLAQRPGKGDLRPWHEPLSVLTGLGASPQRISAYLMASGYWFTWITVVNAIKGFDALDTTERFYFTGSGTPKWTDNVIGLAGGPPYPQAERELSVPAPTTTMTTTVTLHGTAEVADWSYVQTFVNDLGWESGPGPSSATLSAEPDSTITVGNLDIAPSGAYGITLTRVYRSETGADGSAAFFFLGEYAAGTTSITDSSAGDLGEQLATGGIGIGMSWTPPPVDGFGLTRMWNGMLAIASGKSVYVCVPYTPYAYPVAYRIDVADNVVGMGTYGQTMLILTDGDVYVAVGSDPASIDCQPALVKQPCVSARSIVSFEDGVAWATSGGIYFFGDTRNGLMTEALIDPEDGWAAYNATGLVASRYRHLRYYLACPTSGSANGFVVDIDNPTGLYSFAPAGLAAFHQASSGSLYYIDGTAIYEWGGGADFETCSFTSKPFQIPAPVCYSCCQVLATDFPVHIRVWGTNTNEATGADVTTLILDRDVPGQAPVRMQPGKFDQFQVEVTASSPVQAVLLAEDEDDLRNG